MRVVSAVIVTLFVGKSWFADFGVLIERDEVSVFEDGEMGIREG